MDSEDGPTLAGSDALRGLRILVVEDDRDGRDLLAFLLGQFGAEVKSFASAGEGFEQFQEWKPDLLITDIQMPGEDGYSLIRRIRESEPAGEPSLPAIALTAHARRDDRLRALEAGFQIHLTKPFDDVELISVIAGLTGRT